MPKLDLNLETLDLSLAQDSLKEFVRQAWPVIEPTTRLDWSWHHDLIAEYLEAVAAGELRRLIINVQPRSMKSILVTVMFPAWVWATRATERFMCASYSAALASKHSRDRRGVILSPWFQRNWRLRLKDDANTMSDFSSEAGGHMSAVSVGGSVTGRGAMIVICDDLISPAMADSEAERETALRFFDETLSSRLDDKRRGAFVIVEQRTNANDLSGHLMRQGGWTSVALPTVAESVTTITFPRSGRVVTRNAGDLLWPSREGPGEVETARQRLGSFAFQAQHQQNPTPREGSLFKAASIRRYSALPQRFDRLVASLDTAFKTTTTADYSAMVVLGEVRTLGVDGSLPDFYVVTAWRGRVEFSRLKAMAVECASEYQLEAVLIEDAASGQSLVQELKVESNLPVVGIKPDRDKFSRAAAIEPLVQGGRLFLPDGDAPWISDFIAELCAFPAGRHDDWVDALSQGVNFLRWQSDQSFTVTNNIWDEPAPAPSDWLELRRRKVTPLSGESPEQTREREVLIALNLGRAGADPVSRDACVREAQRLFTETIERS